MRQIFRTQDKKLLKCLMIMLKTCLEIFMNQNIKNHHIQDHHIQDHHIQDHHIQSRQNHQKHRVDKTTKDTESTKPPKTDDANDNSNELIKELKKLGVSTKNLINFDSPMDLLTNLHSGITTMEEVEKEQDKYELLLDELNKIDKDNISKNHPI